MMLRHLYQKLSERGVETTLAADDNSHIVSIFDDRELIDVVFEDGRGVEFFYLDKRDYDRQRCSRTLASKRKNALGILHGLLIVLCFGFSAGLFFKLLRPEDPLAFDDSLNPMRSGRVLFYKKDGLVHSDLDAGSLREGFADNLAKPSSVFEASSIR